MYVKTVVVNLINNIFTNKRNHIINFEINNKFSNFKNYLIMEINWKKSKEKTLEGYVNGIMFFDINKEKGRYAVYEMKKSMQQALSRPAFDTEEQAKEFCNKALSTSYYLKLIN